MGKLLKPSILELSPDHQTAASEWTHWYKRFDAFLRSITAITDVQKLDLLINHVSATVYELFDGCVSYDEAIQCLNVNFRKDTSEVFLRHQLLNTTQEAGQTIDQYIRSIESLSKQITFKAITSEEHRNLFLRDTFVAGISSKTIRQRLLECQVLEKDDAYKLARVVESAQCQTLSFGSQPNISPASRAGQISIDKVEITEMPEHNTQIDTECVSAIQNLRKCYFCGNSKHSRIVCPARDVFCRNCNKKGHFAKVCRSKTIISSAVIASIRSSLPFKASLSAKPLHSTSTINGRICNTLIDSGSAINLIRRDVARECGLVERSTQLTVSMAASNHRCSLSKVVSYYTPLFAHLTEDVQPIAAPSRRRSLEEKALINAEVDSLLKDGIIETSNSPWRAQVVMVRSRGKMRMVIDYSQTINKFTLLDAFPLPRIDDIVESLSYYRVFSRLDLKRAYYQVPIQEKDRKYTAFEALGQLYQFKCLPFGLTNAVAIFQRVMTKIISSERLKDTFCYLDDVVIAGKTIEEHDRNLKRFREVSNKYNLEFNSEKCVYASKSICILGYLIENGSIHPDRNRIKPIMDLPEPQNATELKRILGLFAHYSKWLKDFSRIIHPLARSSFPLSEEARSAFSQLKSCLATATLSTIDFSPPFVLETDASSYAIGATLSQNGKPVAFYSCTLNKNANKYSAVEKEALAIIEAVRHWRHYLLGRKFTIITDQRAIAYIFSNTGHSKIKNDKLERWRLELVQYCFDISYRRGQDNVAADALSRCIASTAGDKIQLNKIHEDLCHPGIARLWHFVKTKNLPFSIEDVRNVCRSCAILKPQYFRTKLSTLVTSTRPFERLSVDFKGPLPSTNQNKFSLVVIDEYSRFPFAFPRKNTSSETVIECLSQIFSIFGVLDNIHSDRGTSFTSLSFRKFLLDRGVTLSHCTPYHPSSNGQVEKYNDIIWKAVSLRLHGISMGIDKWQTVLKDALHSIRSLLCTSTNSTPHSRLFTFPRRSTSGTSLPDWLVDSEEVFVKRFNRQTKYEVLVEPAKLIHANSHYAIIERSNGQKDTVSTRHLVRSPSQSTNESRNDNLDRSSEVCRDDLELNKSDLTNNEKDNQLNELFSEDKLENNSKLPTLVYRRSSRKAKPPPYLSDYHVGANDVIQDYLL